MFQVFGTCDGTDGLNEMMALMASKFFLHEDTFHNWWPDLLHIKRSRLWHFLRLITQHFSLHFAWNLFFDTKGWPWVSATWISGSVGPKVFAQGEREWTVICFVCVCVYLFSLHKLLKDDKLNDKTATKKGWKSLIMKDELQWCFLNWLTIFTFAKAFKWMNVSLTQHLMCFQWDLNQD